MPRNPLILPALFIAAATLSAQPDARTAMLQAIDSKRASYADTAKQIWGFAEVGYQEEQSSALLQRQLKAAGFDVLPGLSQEAQNGARKPLVENGAGHGCGHTLLGTGALAAAIAVKDWLIA